MKLNPFVTMFLFGLCAFVTLNAQSPQNPTNPFPNKKTNPPTSQPQQQQPSQTVPPVSSQQIPPSAQPKPSSTSTVPPVTSQQIPPSTQSTTPGQPNSFPSITGTDEEQIIGTVLRVFDAMRLQDSAMARPLFAPNCRLFTPNTNANGQTRLIEEPITSFFKSIGTKRKEIIDERILKYKLDIDGPLASVWADYNLYVDTNFIHCGVDVFQLYKSNEGWKIFELADTRRKTGCTKDPKDEIAAFLDKWHKDAASANGEDYFGAFTVDGVFLGTDATERWTREEFRTWAKPQFDNKRGWNFKPSKRFVSFNADKTIAWFDEELATWMGPCRGSGVLSKINGMWKIKQYNLTILVPNEKVQDYLKVLNAK